MATGKASYDGDDACNGHNPTFLCELPDFVVSQMKIDSRIESGLYDVGHFFEVSRGSYLQTELSVCDPWPDF